MGVGKRLRFEILRRDNHTCRYCGRSAPDVALTVDHVKPAALGGRDEPENLVAACWDCNGGKASVPADAAIVADVAADALRWTKAMKQALWETGTDRRIIQSIIANVEAAWVAWDWNVDGEKRDVPRPLDWPDTLERFINAGLDYDTLKHLIGVAMRRDKVPVEDKWTYFCGCCWRQVEDIQASAKRIIDFEEDRA